MTVWFAFDRALSSTAGVINRRNQPQIWFCSTAHGQASANTSGCVLWNSADLQLPLEQGCPNPALPDLWRHYSLEAAVPNSNKASIGSRGVSDQK